MTRIYVGNLASDTTEASLQQAFSGSGRTVVTVNLKRNATSGKLRGFAFIDMGSPEDAASAIAELHGTELAGKTIKVNAAKDLPGPRTSWRDAAESGGRSRPRW